MKLNIRKIQINPRTLLKQKKIDQRIARSYDVCVKNNISKIENRNLKQLLTSSYDYFIGKKNKSSKLRIAQIDDIRLKYEACTDDKLKSMIAKFLKNKNGSKDSKEEVLDFIEQVLDVSNSAESRYCQLYSSDSTVGPIFADKLVLNIAKIIGFFTNDLPKGTSLLKNKDIGISPVRKFIKQCKRSGIKIDYNDYDFINFTKYAPLEELILKDGKANKKITNYLYEKAYVSKQSYPKLQEFCRKINKKYGIKTLDYSFHEYIPESAYKIEKELGMFNSVLKAKTKLIDLIKISTNCFEFKNHEATAFYKKKSIFLPKWFKNNNFRHEMIHAIDENLSILKKKRKIPKKQIEAELTKIGAPKGSITYANTRLNEAKAVLGEYYSPSYSKEIKDFMLKSGLPKEILNLRDIDFYDYLLRIKNRTPDEIKVLKELRDKFNGIIPQKMCSIIDTIGIDGCKNVLKKLKNKKFDSKKNLEIFTEYINVGKKKREIERLQNDINSLMKRVEIIIAGDSSEVKQELLKTEKKLDIAQKELEELEKIFSSKLN